MMMCLLGLGAVAVSHQAGATPAPGYPAAAPPAAADNEGAAAAAPAAKKRDWVLVPARQQGVLEVIGREVRPGEKVPADKLINVQGRKYVRLVEGDSIRKGELLARIDDALARVDVDIKVAKVDASEAERKSSSATKEEAKTRYYALLELERKAPGAVGQEE